MTTYSRPKLPVWGQSRNRNVGLPLPPRSPSHLVEPLLWTLTGAGDRGSDRQLRTQAAMKKRCGLPPAASTPCVVDSQRKRQERVGPQLSHSSDEAICPSDRIPWTRNAWAQSVPRPGGNLAGWGPGLTTEGMRAHSTRTGHHLHSWCPYCLHWPSPKK